MLCDFLGVILKLDKREEDKVGGVATLSNYLSNIFRAFDEMR